MNVSSTTLRPLVAAFVLAFSLFALTGCPGNGEIEERRAFIGFLNETVAAHKIFPLPTLMDKEKRAFGDYTGHYALLAAFQDTLSREAGKHAEELLALAAFTDLEALAEAEDSLKKAAGEAGALQKIVEDLQAKTDKAKAKLSLPDDLAAVYNTVYDKAVSQPAVAAAAMFSSVRAAFAAIFDLLDFINSHSRDMAIRGSNINLNNIGLKDALSAKMAAVRENTLALSKAHATMTQAMAP